MVRVRKSLVWIGTHAPSSEPYEEFDRTKIETALVRSGARGTYIQEISAKVKPFEGITSEEIDKIVVSELERRDPATAKCWRTKKEYDISRFAGAGEAR
jgi:hypothetical protein